MPDIDENDYQHVLDNARSHITPKWDNVRALRVYAGIAPKRRRRRRMQSLVVSMALLGVGYLSAPLWLFDPPPQQGIAAKSTTPPSTPATNLSEKKAPVLIAGGKAWAAHHKEEPYIIGRNASGTMVIEQPPGLVRYQNLGTPLSPVLLRANSLSIEIAGASFTSEVTKRAVTIGVQEHTVLVQQDHGWFALGAGETRQFGTARSTENIPQEVPHQEEAIPAITPRQSSAQPHKLSAPNEPPPHREGPASIDDLMLEADRYRLQKDTQRAAALLRRVISSWPNDPRAILAAYSLGNVLLNSDSAPQEAALAFSQARTLNPQGPLAEDALMREIEAWTQGKEHERAIRLLHVYKNTYPQGQWLQRLERGMDTSTGMLRGEQTDAEDVIHLKDPNDGRRKKTSMP